MTSKPLYDDSPPDTAGNNWPIHGARIIALSFVMAGLFGIIHERIIAAISPEYFTVGRLPLIKSQSPTQLAIVWGIYTTAIFGVLGGLLLAIVARSGKRPKLTAGDLVRPLAILLVCVALLSVLGGALGWQLAASGQVPVHSVFADRIPKERWPAFMTAGASKNASHLAMLLGGIVLLALVARKRGRLGPPAPARMNREQVRAMRAG